MTGLQFALSPPVSIPVNIRSADAVGAEDSKQDQYSVVQLVSEQWWVPDTYGFRRRQDQQDQASLSPVYPGRYTAQVMTGGKTRVQSLTCGDTDLLRESLVVGSTPPCGAIEVVLVHDAGTLSLTLPADGMYQVIAVPRVATKQGPRAGQLGASFADLSGLTPGDYTVFVFASRNPVPYAEPDFMRKYSGKGTNVTVSGNSTTKVQPQIIGEGQ
jgi:hypothetical protein